MTPRAQFTNDASRQMLRDVSRALMRYADFRMVALMIIDWQKFKASYAQIAGESPSRRTPEES